MPYTDMLDFCVGQGVSAVEIGTGNWSGAPHIDLDALLSSETERTRWHDEMRRRGIEREMEILYAQIVYIQFLERVESLVDGELVVGVPRHCKIEFDCFHAFNYIMLL